MVRSITNLLVAGCFADPGRAVQTAGHRLRIRRPAHTPTIDVTEQRCPHGQQESQQPPTAGTREDLRARADPPATIDQPAWHRPAVFRKLLYVIVAVGMAIFMALIVDQFINLFEMWQRLQQFTR